VTIKLKAAAVTEGHAVITAINLPTELAAGAWITGSIDIRNDGGADTMALVFKTEWDGKYYGDVFDLTTGASNTINLAEGIFAMPNQDAIITFYGCHAQPGGEFIIGATEFKVDDTKTH